MGQEKDMVCSKCDKDIPEESFNKKGAGRQPYCRLCTKQYRRQYYLSNKSLAIDKARTQKRTARLTLAAYKESTPCKDCGGYFKACQLDFDHLVSETKAGDISRMVGRKSQTTLSKEIAKCDLVCANCHRLRTWNRQKH
jgi:hypothetical protein